VAALRTSAVVSASINTCPRCSPVAEQHDLDRRAAASAAQCRKLIDATAPSGSPAATFQPQWI
jgi:hypothetical protein